MRKANHMLDKSTINYIFSYYSRFMTLEEAAAWKHSTTLSKFQSITDERHQWMLEKGWLSYKKEVLKLLNDGYEQFTINTAERILRDNPNKIYFNNCPNCGKLARTPQAKQCRFCGHSWHKQVVATFQVVSAFEVTGRYFLL